MRLLSLPRLNLLALAVGLTLAPGLSQAQAASAADAVSSPAPPTATPAASALPRELGKPEDDIQQDVRSYQVDGLPDASPEALAALTAPFTGKARGYEDMMNAVAAVTRYMQRDLGYYVGLAYLPEQATKDGVIHIAVLPGRLDQIKLNWVDGLPVNRDVIERHLSALKPGDVLRVREVERMVFLVNDLQGVRARFEIEAGREPGTASFVVTPTPEPRLSGRIEADMSGSRYSGTARLGGLATVASPLGQGDAVSINALRSLSGGLTFGSVNYVLPVGARGFKLGGALSRVKYQLDTDDLPADLHGTATSASAFGLYPVVRSRNLNVFSVLSFEDKRFDDRNGEEGTSVVKHSHDMQIGLVGDSRDNLLSGGINTYEFNWLQGRIHADTAVLPQQRFGKFGLGYSRLQNLLANRLFLYARYKGQVARDNLDVTERMALGGASGVRAFAPGEATADTAHLATAELRFLPYENWFGPVSRELAFSAFYDWGHARLTHDPSALPDGTDNTTTLSGYGLGVTWERPSKFALRLSVAWRGVGESLVEANTNRPRANAVLSKSF